MATVILKSGGTQPFDASYATFESKVKALDIQLELGGDGIAAFEITADEYTALRESNQLSREGGVYVYRRAGENLAVYVPATPLAEPAALAEARATKLATPTLG